jgi:hypothetical protein
MIERQDILADLLVALDERGQRFDAMEDFRNALSAGGYRMSYQKGDVRWQTDTDPTTYFKILDGTPLAQTRCTSIRAAAPRFRPGLQPRGSSRSARSSTTAASGRIEHEVLIDAPAR